MKNKKIISSKINTFEVPESITSNITQQLSSKIHNLIIEGLRRKGFTFESDLELIAFVKEHCHSQFNYVAKETMYFVDNEPFLLIGEATIERVSDTVIAEQRYAFTID